MSHANILSLSKQKDNKTIDEILKSTVKLLDSSSKVSEFGSKVKTYNFDVNDGLKSIKVRTHKLLSKYSELFKSFNVNKKKGQFSKSNSRTNLNLN